jgi:uncharacterized protein involved in outer membrane biogenesis
MTTHRLRRALFVLAIAAVLLAVAAGAALHFAARALKSQVEQALGTDSEVAEIVVGWSAIEARGVRIRAPQGWPAEDALRAERVVVSPDLLGLLSARVHVPRIRIEQAYVSVWRTREGRLRLLPSLLEKPAAAHAGGTPALAVGIGRIELQEGVLEFFDATVRQPAYKTRLEQLHAVVEDLQVPSLAGRTQLQLDGTIKGPHRNGKLALDGWMEFAAKNSELAARLGGVDLPALQPYLIKTSETGVRQGTLDLTLKSTVRNNRLHAPGTVTLSGLELAPAGGAFGTFMGVPRQAVRAALKDRKDQIAIHFTLEGDLDDPRFSLNESFAKRVGEAVAENLGISIEGLTRGVGGAVEGLGGVMKKLFGK